MRDPLEPLCTVKIADLDGVFPSDFILNCPGHGRPYWELTAEIKDLTTTDFFLSHTSKTISLEIRTLLGNFSGPALLRDFNRWISSCGDYLTVEFIGNGPLTIVDK